MTYKKIIFTIMVEIGTEDPHFDFLAGVLSYCVAHNGITDKQKNVIDKYVELYNYLFEEVIPTEVVSSKEEILQ